MFALIHLPERIKMKRFHILILIAIFWAQSIVPLHSAFPEGGVEIIPTSAIDTSLLAPSDATYILQTADGDLSSAQALDALGDGLLKHSSGVIAQAIDGTDYISSVVADTTPQLGGALDAQTNDITDIGNLAVGIDTPTSQVHIKLDSINNILIDGATNNRGVTVGAIRQLHTPSITGTRAYNIVIDANNKADTKAITIEYNARGISAGDANAGLELTIDTSNSTGGHIDGLHVSKVGSGSISPSAIHANVGVSPVDQDSGAFGAIEQAWDANGGFADVTTAFNSAGTDVTIFDTDADYIYIGDAATFSDISVVLTTAASNPGVKPTFEFSAGASSWTSFGANDGSNGFRVNGVIAWNVSDLSGWATDTVNGVASKYWIRIQRNQASLSTAPIEDLIQIASGIQYTWDEDGNIIVNSTTVSNTGLHILDTDDSHDLIIKPGSDITADRTLTLTTGDSDRTITLSGNPTLDDWFDQSVKSGTSPTFDGANITGISAANVSVATGVGSPTIDQVQEYFDNTGSSGFFLGGALSDGGAGLVDVAAGSGFIRTTNDDNAELQSFKWSASAGIAVTDDTTQYVYVDDSGTISLSTSEFLETPDKILIGVVTDEGAAIESVFQLGVRLEEGIGQAGRFMRGVHGIERNKRVGGLIFGQSGDANRDVTMTSGQLEWGRTSYPMSAFDTSGADTFTIYSANGQEDAAASQWPNTQYDNAGTLTTMSNNSKWANLFCWLEPNDKIIMVYGRAEFNSQAGAEAEAVPSSSLPTRISETGILATRFTFQKSANTATIESAFDALFANAAVTDHSNLASLAWTSSGHTGTVSVFAGFDGAGAATEYTESNYILADGTRAFGGNQDFGTNDITGVGSLGVTGARLTKGWFTDLEVTNAIEAIGIVNSSGDINITPTGTVSLASTSVTQVTRIGDQSTNPLTSCTSNGTTTLAKASAWGFTPNAGDRLMVVSATTSADKGLYSIVSFIQDTSFTLKRAFSGSDADVSIEVWTDCIIFSYTDGTNGNWIMNASGQDKNIQIGGDSFEATGHGLGSEDVLIGGNLFEVKAGTSFFDGIINASGNITVATAASTGTIGVNGDNNVTILVDRGTAARIGEVQFKTTGSLDWVFGVPDSDLAGDGTEFFIGMTSGGINPSFWIETNGNVAIGHQIPEEKLHVDDAIAVSNNTEGSVARMAIRTTHETHTLTLGATSDTTTISVPSGALLLGASFNVDTAVTDTAGDDTWSAAFITGDTSSLASGAAAAQNTKIDTTLVPVKTTDVTQIQFTPQGGNFSAGIIEIVVYYIDFTSLDDV